MSIRMWAPGKTVNISGLTLGGTDAGNYALPSPTTTANIWTKSLTVTGITASSREYDGTTTATLDTGSVALVGVVSGDVVNLGIGGAAGAFDNENVGTGKTVTVSGLSISGTDFGNYTLTPPTTTANITTRAITVTAATDTKEYDGTPSSAEVPTITAGSLAAGDIATWTQTFDNKNVGTGKTLTPAGVVSDGNGGNNYAVTFANTTGVINPLAASVTPNAASKTYGDADPPLTGTLSGFLPADGVAATYSRTAGETVAGSPYTISATLSPVGVLSNYTITYNTADFIINALGAPTVDSFAPASGGTGTSVTITGTNFIGVTAVSIGGTAATSFHVDLATQITAVVGGGATGVISVTTLGGTANSLDTFTYYLAPTISTVSPCSGSNTGGTDITITGTNFISGATVTIGGNPATSPAVVNPTTITAVTPSGTLGDTDIIVTTAGGSATLTGGFTYALIEAPEPTGPGPAVTIGNYVNGYWGNDTDPTLPFSQHHNDLAATVRYHIQIDNDSNFSSPVLDYTSNTLLAVGPTGFIDTSFTVGQAAGSGTYTAGNEGQILANGPYYWRVKSIDMNGKESCWAVANGGDIAFLVRYLADDFETEVTGSGNDTVSNIAGADTEAIKTGTGTPKITIARYIANPGGSIPAGFNAAGGYFDVYADSITGIDGIEIRHYYTDAEISGQIESTLKMYYQSGAGWALCSDTGVNTAAITVSGVDYSGYIWANITATTTPPLSYLRGSAFCGLGQTTGGGGGGGGGGFGGGSGSGTTNRLLDIDMLGLVGKVAVTDDGITIEPHIVFSLQNLLTLELSKGTKIISGSEIPTELALTVTNEAPPPPQGMVIVSQVYDCVAYTDGGTAKSVNFNPAVILEINYNPQAVPEDASAIFIAYYDEATGLWVPLNAPSGYVAETGTAAALVSHFTPFAVLAKLPTAYFAVSNLDISPSQVKIGEEVTISAQVANTGGMSGEYTLVMNVEGLPQASQVVELSAGQSQEVSFTVALDAAGSYQVEIGGLQGSFVVVAAEAGGFNWLPWLISVTTAMALAALGFILVRRRQQPAPAVAGGKHLKSMAEELPARAAGPSRFGKAMAAITTIARKRPQPTTKDEEPSEVTPTAVTVNASVAGGRGSVNPVMQTVNSGESATITFTPRKGYHIGSITDNGSAVPITNPYVIEEVTAKHKVAVTFAPDTLTITASATSGGSISPSGKVMVNNGANQVFTIAPKSGYHVEEVLVDGSPVKAATSYTFTNVTADHTISASFAIDTLTVNAKVSGGHGSLSPVSQTVSSGTSAAITITPDTGYHIASITDNGSPAPITNPYVIEEVTDNHTVVVTFAMDAFTVNASVSEGHGSVSPVAQTVNPDTSATITFTPRKGYYIASITDNGTSVPITNPYVIEEVTDNHTVVVTFASDAVEKPSEPTPTVAEELREPAPPLSPAKDLKIIPNQVKPGGIINVFAEVTNNGSEKSSFSVVLKVRDIVEAVKEISLGPKQTQRVAFTVLRDKPGVYDVDLEGLKGSFTVTK